MAYFRRLVYKELISAYDGTGIDLGTPKHIPRVTVYSADPGTGDIIVDCSDYVPVGTKAVGGYYYVRDTGTNHYVGIRKDTLVTYEEVVYSKVANIPEGGLWWCTLNGSRQFSIHVSDVGFDLVALYVNKIWL